jgi:hypothetical protein
MGTFCAADMIPASENKKVNIRNRKTIPAHFKNLICIDWPSFVVAIKKP